jgi:mannose-1-phosphate guanylyltransferase
MIGSDAVAMLLCAGLGTRLRPLTDWLPKPAAPVCGLPLVHYALARMRACGIRRAVVNTHHLPQAMALAARAASERLGVQLAISHEPVIAGTGGALREAKRLLADASAIVLWNGDILFDVDLGQVLEAHLSSAALATMVLMPMPAGARYAAVEVDAEGAVRRIAGRFGPGGEGLTPLHFTGVHLLSPAVLDAIAAAPFECDINRHVYPPLMDGRVRALRASGYWNDLGTAQRYLEANLDVLRGRVPLKRLRGADPFTDLEPFAGPGVWLGRGAHVESGAALEAPVLVGPHTVIEAGATFGPDAIAGAGCRVAAGATVRESVLLDGTALEPGETVEGQIAGGGLRLRAKD